VFSGLLKATGHCPQSMRIARAHGPRRKAFRRWSDDGRRWWTGVEQLIVAIVDGFVWCAVDAVTDHHREGKQGEQHDDGC